MTIVLVLTRWLRNISFQIVSRRQLFACCLLCSAAQQSTSPVDELMPCIMLLKGKRYCFKNGFDFFFFPHYSYGYQIQYRPKLIGLVFKLLLWPRYSSYRLRDWCHSKDLELRIPKHIQLVKIAHIRPEKIEFNVGRLKFKMYVFEFWAPHNALFSVPVPVECAVIPQCPALRCSPGESGGALCCRPGQHKSWVSCADCVTRSGDPKESPCPEPGLAVLSGLSPKTMIAVITFIAPTAQRSPSQCSRMVWSPKLSWWSLWGSPSQPSLTGWTRQVTPEQWLLLVTEPLLALPQGPEAAKSCV